MRRLFLGVDGGQSSTIALIADETGAVLGAGSAGPCNHVAGPEGRTKFVDAISGCLSAACAAAHLDPAEAIFEAACLGFSGGPEDKRGILEQILKTRKLIVTTDALIALSGATAGEPGLIVIAGTGSIAFGRNRDGKVARAGGWGYVFGDEGGAFDIVRQAVRAILRFEEGWGPETALHTGLLAATGASTANDLMHRFYTTEFTRQKIASYAPLVDKAAQAGDKVAQEILLRAAHSLAALAGAVRAQLFPNEETTRVSYIGGVFRSAIVRGHFEQIVCRRGDACGPPKYGPAAGALLEAYQAAGVAPQLKNLPEFKT